jgi:hypothetical protein
MVFSSSYASTILARSGGQNGNPLTFGTWPVEYSLDADEGLFVEESLHLPEFVFMDEQHSEGSRFTLLTFGTGKTVAGGVRSHRIYAARAPPDEHLFGCGSE